MNDNKIVQEFLQNAIHQMLKNSRSIDEFEEHDIIFKVSIPCLKCCLPFIACFDAYKTICTM
jgi:hypothetical protein